MRLPDTEENLSVWQPVSEKDVASVEEQLQNLHEGLTSPEAIRAACSNLDLILGDKLPDLEHRISEAPEAFRMELAALIAKVRGQLEDNATHDRLEYAVEAAEGLWRERG